MVYITKLTGASPITELFVPLQLRGHLIENSILSMSSSYQREFTVHAHSEVCKSFLRDNCSTMKHPVGFLFCITAKKQHWRGYWKSLDHRTSCTLMLKKLLSCYYGQTTQESNKLAPRFDSLDFQIFKFGIGRQNKGKKLALTYQMRLQ